MVGGRATGASPATKDPQSPCPESLSSVGTYALHIREKSSPAQENVPGLHKGNPNSPLLQFSTSFGSLSYLCMGRSCCKVINQSRKSQPRTLEQRDIRCDVGLSVPAPGWNFSSFLKKLSLTGQSPIPNTITYTHILPWPLTPSRAYTFF